MCTGLTTKNLKRKALRFALQSALFLIACLTGMLAQATTAHPRFAYVVNEFDDSVSMFIVDAVSGKLQHNGFVPAGHFPFRLVVDPSGLFAYVTNGGSGSVTQYEINPQTGALSQVDVSTVGNSPGALVIDPTGRFMYVCIGNAPGVAAFTINQGTGAITANGPSLPVISLPTGIVMDPAGQLVYVLNGNSDIISAFSVNPNGTLTPQGTTPSPPTPTSFAIDHSGRFLYVSHASTSNDVTTYAITPGTGALTQVGLPVHTDLLPLGVTIDPTGRFLYTANRNSNTVSQFQIDPVTGALTSLGLISAVLTPTSMVLDPSGQFAYVTGDIGNAVGEFSIDPVSAAWTPITHTVAQNFPVHITILGGATPVVRSSKFAYVGDVNSLDIESYLIHPASGLLSPTGSISTDPTYLLADPASNFLYMASAGAGQIATFSIDQGDGFLTSSGSPVGAGCGPNSMAIDLSNRFAYATNGCSLNVSTYSINPDGSLTEVGTPVSSPPVPRSVVLHPSGKFAYVVNQSPSSVAVYTINTTTGVLSPFGQPLSTGDQPFNGIIDPTGQFLYVANAGSANISIFFVNGQTGALTFFTNAAAGSAPVNLAIDPLGRFLYAVNMNDATISMYTINPTLGNLTSIGPAVSAPGAPFYISVDPSGRFVYVSRTSSNRVSIFSIDQTSGQLTFRGEAVTGNSPESLTTTGIIRPLVFFDDFSDGDIHRYVVVKGHPQVVNGQLELPKGQMIVPAQCFATCTIRASLNLPTDGKASILLIADKKNLVELLIDQGKGKVILKQKKNGQQVGKNAVKTPISAGDPHEIAFSFDGTNFDVAMDAIPLIFTPQQRDPDSNDIELKVKNGTTFFDNISIDGGDLN